MKIFINSRKVDSYRLKIYDETGKLFDGLMYSSPKGFVEIGDYVGDTLTFSWDFNLLNAEEKELKAQDDCPMWGINSYDFIREGPFGTPGFEWIDIELCPMSLLGVYNTVISNIPTSYENLHLYFRKSKFNSNFPVLDIASREENKDVTVAFRKSANIDSMIENEKKSNKKMTLVNIGIIVVLLTIIMLAEKYFPKWYIIFPAFFILFSRLKAIYEKIQRYKKFTQSLKEMDDFVKKGEGI